MRQAQDTSHFGGFCKALRLDRGIGFDEFRLALGVSKAYLNDVETGKARPPAPDTQLRMAKLLGRAKELSADERANFFTFAARERGELPADVAEFLKVGSMASEIRQSKAYIEFWQKYDI